MRFEIVFMLALPMLNALGFVLYTFIVGSSWIFAAFLGLITSSTLLLVLLCFTDQKMTIPPVDVIPYLIGSSACFLLAELVKMKNLSYASAIKLSYIGLTTPFFVILFSFLFSSVQLNKWHIIGGIISSIGAGLVFYGGK